jgi:hypothetical protein
MLDDVSLRACICSGGRSPMCALCNDRVRGSKTMIRACITAKLGCCISDHSQLLLATSD